MDDLIARLGAAAADFDRLRAGVAAGEPWPLSPAYGAEPESSWGPKEVLAHVAEMIPFWTAEIGQIAGARSGPIPFGRVATDPARIGRIGADRELPSDVLFDRVAAGASEAAARFNALAADDADRKGIHPRLGEMTVEESVGRFIVGHLEEHVGQLSEILAARTGG